MTPSYIQDPQKPQLQLHPSSNRYSVSTISPAPSLRPPVNRFSVATFENIGWSMDRARGKLVGSSIDRPTSPTATMSSGSMASKIVRVGRGGRGNLHQIDIFDNRDTSPDSKKQIQKDTVVAPVGLEMPVVGALGNKSSGRGGSGNIRNARNPVISGASNFARVELERKEREVLEKRRHEQRQRTKTMTYSTGRGGLGNLKGKTANKGKKKEESNMSPTRISFNTRGSYSPSLASQVLSSQTGTLSSIVASTLNSVGSRPRRSASMSSFRRLGLECYELESFCGSSKSNTDKSQNCLHPIQHGLETSWQSFASGSSDQLPSPNSKHIITSTEAPDSTAESKLRTSTPPPPPPKPKLTISTPIPDWDRSFYEAYPELKKQPSDISTYVIPVESPDGTPTPKATKKNKLRQLFISKPSLSLFPSIVSPQTPSLIDSASTNQTIDSATYLTDDEDDSDAYQYAFAPARHVYKSDAGEYGRPWLSPTSSDYYQHSEGATSSEFEDASGDLEVRCYEDLENNLALRLAMARLRLM